MLQKINIDSIIILNLLINRDLKMSLEGMEGDFKENLEKLF